MFDRTKVLFRLDKSLYHLKYAFENIWIFQPCLLLPSLSFSCNFLLWKAPEKDNLSCPFSFQKRETRWITHSVFIYSYKLQVAKSPDGVFKILNNIILEKWYIYVVCLLNSIYNVLNILCFIVLILLIESFSLIKSVEMFKTKRVRPGSKCSPFSHSNYFNGD